jgi:YesN/AraC family two-component response regulator
MVMPIMGGMATVRALQKINPNVAIVAMSGMLAHKHEAETLGNAVRSFLPKPYTAEHLLKTLQDVLNPKD